MTCYFPLHAFKDKGEDPSKTYISFRRSGSWKGERLELPCGRCIGCRLERSRQWAVRCMHEASLYDRNCFLTLTYDDDHLPKDGSLHLDDFQCFMKRLRKKFGVGIRFFHSGEYGEINARPHYHSLLFNHDFDDKTVFSQRGEHRLFVSDTLSKLWPFGFSSIGSLTFESAGYVARYALKKVTGKGAEDFYGGRKPEYSTMSRRPGIGSRWFEKFSSEVYPRDGVIVRGHLSKPPRYYDNLLAKSDRSTFELAKIAREKSGQRFVEDVLSDGRVVVVSDSSSERLKVREEVKRAQMCNLKRSLGA